MLAAVGSVAAGVLTLQRKVRAAMGAALLKNRHPRGCVGEEENNRLFGGKGEKVG